MAQFKSNRGLVWNYEVVGNGEPLLFIHGFGASSHLWKSQIDFLMDDFRVITVDLPGHGKSQWMPVTINDMAVDLRQLINFLNETNISIVASSFGGLIALELYRLMTGHVMRISLVGSVPKFTESPNYPAGLDIEKIRKLSGQFDGDYASVLDMFFRSLFTFKERESLRFKWVKQMWEGEQLPNRDALKTFLDILEKTDMRDRIASVICPLQFITGAEDYLCPREVMAWVAEHTYNARFDFIEGCGHLPFLTEFEEYNRLLEDFLIS